VRKRFRFVSSERQLYRWKRQIERQEASLPLTKKTVYEYDRQYAELIEAKQNKCSFNDSDLRDWAINIASEMGISNFQASGTWITRFKQAHRIGSQRLQNLFLETMLQTKQWSSSSKKIFEERSRFSPVMRCLL
jgi:hypothetical protein